MLPGVVAAEHLGSLARRALVLMIGSFVYLSLFRRAAGLDLRAGPCRGRQIRAGTGVQMSEPADASTGKTPRGCAEGALARLLDVLGRDGEEARVVGGAVRNALLGEPITRSMSPPRRCRRR